VARSLRDRFHILAGETCNNRCLFCMEGPSERRHGVTAERVLELLQASSARDEVMFTSGEPTLNPRLPDYLRWARELGYRRIGLTTNGRRLGYEPYARSLLDAGLNHVVVSIHGPDGRCHDAQTRSPGSFAQTLAGLEALTRLRRERRFTVHTSTVVGRRNVARLTELYWILHAFAIDQCVFNVLQPIGFPSRLVPSLTSRYADVVSSFGRLAREVGAGRRPAPFLVDVPPCVTERLPAQVRGWVECAAFTEYGEREEPRERQTRVAKELENRVKREECARCRHTDGCLGVWTRYVDAYGWDEFVPVSGAR
jgi:pyruvate-formate lyase-activating enzyme